MTDLLVTQTTLVGLVLATAKENAVSAHLWPVEGALEMLAAEAPTDGAIARAARKWVSGRPSPTGRVVGLRTWARDAYQRGLLTPRGYGWDAEYQVDARWLQEMNSLACKLEAADRAALSRAAQALVAMSTMLSKKSVAA